MGIVLILIGLFCVPFILASLDYRPNWRTPEFWRDTIIGLISLAVFIWLFL